MDQIPAPGQPVSSGIATAVASQLPRNDEQTPALPPSPPVVPTSSNIAPLAQGNIINPANQTAANPINQQSTINNQQSLSSGHPEVKAGPAASPEIGEIEVIPESPEISPELAEHVERVTRGEIELPGPIEAGVHEGQPVTIQPAAPQQPNIVLPLTRGDFTAGPNQPVSSSWRWLYEFVKRIILMMPGRAVYREN